jgi:hypothetical protein
MRKILLWIAVILPACLLISYGFITGSERLSDFAGYYTSAKILVTTDSVSLIYEDEWFIDKMHSYDIPDSTIIMLVNPPTVSFIMVPLAWLQSKTAKTVWNLITLIFLIIAFSQLLKLYNLSGESAKTIVIFALLTCTTPLLRNLQLGQVYSLMLVVLIFFVYFYINKKTILASLFLAVLLLLKYFGWMFFILFLMEKRWKEIGLTSLFFLFGFLLTVFLVGPETYQAHFNVLSNTLHQRVFDFTGLPSIPALFGGLFTFHSQWNPNPVGNLPILATLLSAVSLIGMMVITFHKIPANDLSRLAAIVVLSVIFTPLAAEHHYILLILPASYLLLEYRPAKNGFFTALIIFILFYFLFGWYFQPIMSMESGWAKLIAFPRLYAAILVWYLILHHSFFNR